MQELGGSEGHCPAEGGILRLTSSKGWEPTFLIRAFGLSEELSTKVGFAFSNNGLKFQDLQFEMKKKF